MMRSAVILVIYSLILVSCKEDIKTPDVQSIVDSSISASGGDVYRNSIVSFKFRGKAYKAVRSNNRYVLNRFFADSLGGFCDELTNDGFSRYINQEYYPLADSLSDKYRQSVNSVHYFAMLPYGLNDRAVNKKYEGTTTIKNQRYERIKVSFNAEGGGDDFDDVFIYWINKETKFVDYLAYEYHTDGGGKRFREAFNPRLVNGIRFVDYNNLKPIDKERPLDSLEIDFKKGELKLLSKIELEEIEVIPLTECSNC
ncbi:DUF6503 family protein [Spongiivirga citrea]|uniref:Deoxyribose-phosphate aldolase n=1 Tax=Spongiivirga citrea TaxID=1481457 RepID=A0A6M0CHZ7_9FLAO|nr:DUF6503 family protein [Spongiivirga citrea]NER17588.1 deoxyribose-phosphate aldolase [Spongiivirga citrea]